MDHILVGCAFCGMEKGLMRCEGCPLVWHCCLDHARAHGKAGHREACGMLRHVTRSQDGKDGISSTADGKFRLMSNQVDTIILLFRKNCPTMPSHTKLPIVRRPFLKKLGMVRDLARSVMFHPRWHECLAEDDALLGSFEAVMEWFGTCYAMIEDQHAQHATCLMHCLHMEKMAYRQRRLLLYGEDDKSVIVGHRDKAILCYQLAIIEQARGANKAALEKLFESLEYHALVHESGLFETYTHDLPVLRLLVEFWTNATTPDDFHRLDEAYEWLHTYRPIDQEDPETTALYVGFLKNCYMKEAHLLADMIKDPSVKRLRKKQAKKRKITVEKKAQVELCRGPLKLGLLGQGGEIR